ncbi:MAG: efflux RND transporter periplasmic adaptor subunit [Chlamydiae bacterium]|nr:efflux RND transporter periplasmic adaptor subunit [Chlamydiota bacterium]
MFRYLFSITAKFLIACYLGLFILSCRPSEKGVVPPIPVMVMEVIPQTIPANFEYVAVAESSHIVELRARIEGYLDAIVYKEGSLVLQDELMFVIDQRPFVDKVHMAQGELERQRAKLWNAEQTKNRMVPLYEQNAVSQKDLDDALAEVLATEASVAIAKADLEEAKLNLSFASIQAPVTGVSSLAKFREGALISPGPDSLLTTIYVIDPIWVNFSVSEGDILKARKEMAQGLLKYPENMEFKIEVVMADGSTLPAEGRIDFTDPALQQSTGTMLVRSVLANPKAFLKPGQFVRAVVKGATRPNAIIVPQTAVQQGQNGIFVYVVNASGKAELRPVETGDWYEDYWIITSGLKKGELVVAQGVNRIHNGAEVHVISKIPPSPKKVPSSQEDALGL